LGRTVRDIMSRGELVSSAIMVALIKKRMKDHPGKRVLLDGFPRSIENAT
jgi:adenylate kinase